MALGYSLFPGAKTLKMASSLSRCVRGLASSVGMSKEQPQRVHWTFLWVHPQTGVHLGLTTKSKIATPDRDQITIFPPKDGVIKVIDFPVLLQGSEDFCREGEKFRRVTRLFTVDEDLQKPITKDMWRAFCETGQSPNGIRLIQLETFNTPVDCDDDGEIKSLLDLEFGPNDQMMY